MFVLAAADWDAYLAAWGAYPHAIFMRLPASLDCSQHMRGDAAWRFNPGEGRGHGIGYSRLCIQLVAFRLGLQFVWVLDDNVRETREMDLGYIEANRCHSTEHPPKLCALSLPMKHIEGLVHPEPQTPNLILSTLSHRLSTLHPKPQTLKRETSTLNPEPEPYTLNNKTLNPKRQTLSLEP